MKYRDTRRYDGQTGWFLPDDFLQNLEHPDHAAARIAKDQLGSAVKKLHLSFIESFGNGAWHLIFHYRADLGRRPRVRNGENVTALDWFDLRNLPASSEVAHHGWALQTLAHILKNEP